MEEYLGLNFTFEGLIALVAINAQRRLYNYLDGDCTEHVNSRAAAKDSPFSKRADCWECWKALYYYLFEVDHVEMVAGEE